MELEKVTAEQEKFLQAARALALSRMPYMASVLFAFRAVSAPGLGTYACDPQLRLYIDFEAATALGVEHASQALLHECMHIFRQDHLLGDELGVGEESAKLLNIATDAANNDDLRDAGCAIFADDNAYGHILPGKLGQRDHLTAHEYFRALQRLMPPPAGGGGAQPGDGGGGKGEGTGGYSGCGSAAGNAWGGELGEGESLGGAAPAATATEVERVNVATAVAIKEHDAKGQGRVPADLVARAEVVLAPPKVPWQKVLGRVIRTSVRQRTGSGLETYTRRNARRHDARILGADGQSRRIVLPAQVTPQPTVRVIRDTSGSMSASELTAITSEVVAISKRVGATGDDLIITDFDAEAHGDVKFKRATDLEQVRGRGGTDMARAIDEAMVAKPSPSVIVVMTDGFTGWPAGPTKRIPVVAAIVGAKASQRTADVPSWITAVAVELD